MNVLRLRPGPWVPALICGGLACSIQGTGAPISPPALQVIPQPQEVKAVGDGFAASKARFIVVSAVPEDRFTARLLRDALRETHGLDCDLALLPQKDTNQHQLWLGATRAWTAPLETVSGKGNESYSLSVSPAGVLVSAATEAGLFYGTQTLIQLLEQGRREQAELPGVVVRDWPTFQWRGRYFDGSQYLGTIVPTRANLEREIKLLARYKLNCLAFDAYNLVPFKSFPYCADATTLSLADWDYLVELAHRYHVTFFPSLQSFAQIYQVIWNCAQGKPFREETAPGLICPSRPENIAFLQGLYRDLIDVFRYNPALCVGCSEVGMQWQKHYCDRCKQRIDKGETLQDIFYKHVRNCVQAVEAAAKEVGRPVRPMMWADEFYCGYDNKRWVGIENIPTNTLMGHWQYWSRYQNMPGQGTKDYDGISGLLQRGFDVFFLSASFEFNTYLHDLSPKDPTEGKWEILYDAGIYNIADQARWAEAHNGKGLPGKVWGGACATFSQHDVRCWDTTWFAYALQAEYAWGDPKRPLESGLARFTDAFTATFYGARDQETARAIASAYRELDGAKSDIERNNYLIRDIIGEYDIHDAAYVDNTLEGTLKLIDDLAAKPKGEGKSVADIRRRSERALELARSFRQRLAGYASRVENAYSFKYLISASHKIENHARRTLFLLDLAEAFRNWAAAQDLAARRALRPVLGTLQERCEALQADTRLIADEMDALAYGAAGHAVWGRLENSKEMSAGDTSGYHKVLASLAEFQKRLKEAAATR